MSSDGGFDFLARRGPSQVEVECKFISADIGRQIHRRRLYDLGGVLFPASNRNRDRVTGGKLVRVLLPDRLTSNREHQTALTERIWTVIRDSTSLIDDPVCRVVAENFPLEDSPFSAERSSNVTMDDIGQFLGRAMNIDNAHALLNWQPGQGAIVVHVQSSKPDRVLDEIFRTLKDDAKRQFSGRLPGFLCVHLADVTKDQLKELADADRTGTVTGLQRAASILLQIRPHLHSVALMTDGEVSITRQRTGRSLSTSVQETGPLYIFKNRDHPMANEPSLQTFI